MAGPKLQGFRRNHTKPCRPWREKLQRFSAKSMVWELFSPNYNVIAVPLALVGLATPLAAALAMSLSSITVSLNALRLR